MGPDEMYLKVLRELADKTVKPLCIVSEKMLSSSEVPSDWEQGNITPPFKKGKKARTTGQSVSSLYWARSESRSSLIL